MGQRRESVSRRASFAPPPDICSTHANDSSREKNALYFSSDQADCFPYDEQLDLFNFASTVLHRTTSIYETISETIAKIHRDLRPSTCSIFYLDELTNNIMAEHRDELDSRSSPLRKIKSIDTIFGATPSKNAMQHLVYLPQVSSSQYQQQHFLPRDDDSDLYESVLYISILENSNELKVPFAAIEVSSRQVHAFNRQQQLYLRTMALILGKAIERIRVGDRHKKMELVNELYNSLEINLTGYCDCLRRVVKDRIFEVIKCEGLCLYEVNPEDGLLMKRVEFGAKFSDVDILFGAGFEGNVAKSKMLHCIDDAENDDRFNKECIPCHIEHVKSVLCAPIINKANDLLGVVSCYNKMDEKLERTQFSEQDKTYLSEISGLLSVYTSLCKLEKDKNKERKRAKYVLAVMNYMKKIKRSQNDSREVMKLLSKISNDFISVDRVTFFAVDEIRQELVCIASKEDIIIGLKVSIGEGVVGIVARDGQTVNVKDAYSYAKFNSKIDSQTGYKTKNILAIPIRDHHNKIIAVMQLLNKEGGNFDELDEEILAIFAEEVAPAIKLVIMEMNEYNGIVFKDNSALSRETQLETPMHSKEVNSDSHHVAHNNKRKKGQKTSIEASLEEFTIGNDSNIIQLTSWELDILQYSKITLIAMVEKMFIHYDLPTIFDFEVEVLYSFIQSVMAGYKGNAFHNFHHAVSVVHTTFLMLVKGGVDEYLEDRDIFAVLFAALIHDLEHTGNNNDFEVRAQTQLALKYNDQSVLENHAAASAFKLAKRPESNIFKNFSDEDFRYTRRAIIDIVIQTDMVHHLELMKKIVDITDNTETASALFDITEEKSRKLLSCLVVHASDLSNPAHCDFNVVRRWSIRVCEEFSSQAKKEREIGLKVTNFMYNLKSELEIAKLQLGFVNYVVLPLWKTVSTLFPKAAHFVENCQRNAKLWQDIIDKSPSPDP